MVRILVDNIYSQIVGDLPPEVHIELGRVLSYKIAHARFLKNKRKWDGRIKLYQDYNQSFFTGLMALVRETLKNYGVEYEIIDRRIRPPQNYSDLKFVPPPIYQERPYQKFSVNRALKFTRGILKICTGGGKTFVVIDIIGRIKSYPFVYYVLSTDLMEQAYDNLSSSLNCKIGRIGGGNMDIQNITICTVQSAVRALNESNKDFKIDDYIYDDEDVWDETVIKSKDKNEKIRMLISLAQGLYMDECHHAAARTARDVLQASTSAYWRYAGSATPYREDNAELQIQAMFGSKIVDINASYLIKKNYLVKPYIYIEPIENQKDFHSFDNIYKHNVVENSSFNRHIADTSNHLIKRGLTVLILVRQYAQGDFIKTLIPGSEFITGREDVRIRTKALSGLREKKIKCLIATSLADEGLDIPTLDAVLLAGGGASSTRVHQRIGRTIRKDKDGRKDKSIVVVYDHYNTRFLRLHTDKIRKILKHEPEFIVRNSNGPKYICSEIDEVLGFENDIDGIFDV